MTVADITGRAKRVRLTRGEILGIAAFWTFMALLTALGAYLDPRRQFDPGGMRPGQIALPFIEYYLWALLTPLVFWVASAVGIERTQRVQRVLLLLAVGLVLAIGMDVILSWFRLELFPSPRRPRFGGSPPTPFSGIRRLFFLDDFALYLAVLAAGLAREYSWRLRRRHEDAVQLEAEKARLTAQLAEARMTALRTQLNPHFLFNTLNAVSSLVERDPKGVRRMIARLSELLRHTLEGADTQETPLERELDLTQRYLEIMEVRFQGNLEVTTRVPADLADAMVPNLLLQPLVENAIKHGIGELPEKGSIIIEAERQADALVLRVLDNGPGVRMDSDERGVGLRNTRERLHGLYGDVAGLTLSNRADGGACAEVRLPYHTAAELRAAAPREA